MPLAQPSIIYSTVVTAHNTNILHTSFTLPSVTGSVQLAGWTAIIL